MARPVTLSWRRVMPMLGAPGRHGGALLGVFGVLVLWTSVLLSLAVQREQAIRAATDNASNLARALEEQVIRSVGAIDQTLLYVRGARASNPAGFNLYGWVQAIKFLPDLVLNIALIDRAGRLSGSSLFPNPHPIDLGDRDYVRTHTNTSPDTLYISHPVVGRVTSQPVIMMSRKLVAADGSCDGVVAASVSSTYLARFYKAVDLGAGGVVVLAGTDGVVRARASAGDDGVGQSLKPGPLFDRMAVADSGTFEVASKVDGVRRLYAFRAVRGLPLIVIIGVAKDEILADYTLNRRYFFLGGAALTLLLLVVTAQIERHQSGLRRAEVLLRASEAAQARKSELLEAAVENMSHGIMMVDADRRVTVCNRRAMRKLGVPESLMASRPLFDDVIRCQLEHGEFVDDGGDPEAMARVRALAASIAETPQSYERTRPNGQVIEVHSTPLRGGGMVRTLIDITERKAAETVLREARDAADRAARAKSEFLAMMSHEIRSPMNGMLGIIELLRDTKLEAEQASMVELAHESAKALLQILNDVLDFSKIDAGAAGISAEPTSLRELVRILVAGNVVIAERKGLQLRWEVAADVPDWIIVDPVRLRQILGNLLGNAIKFTASGRVELTVARGTLPEGGEALAFAVTDSGIGMAPDVVRRLFEPFMQEDASTAKNYGGTGLGLSISRGLARLMGGDVAVASTRGEGSVFTLTIPLAVGIKPDLSGNADTVTPGGTILHGLRLLAVEDQAINRWLMQRQFERLGVVLTLAEDGHQAMAALVAQPFDVMVTDCHMPGMDGMELATRARAAEQRAGGVRMPILGLTADITPETRARCLAAGMDDVVSKPINLPRLQRALQQIIARQDADGQEAPAAPDVEADRLFDESTYQDLFDEADEAGGAWLAAYVEVAGGIAQAVRQAIVADDRVALKSASHQMAGSSLSVGATRLGMLARALEGAAADATAAELAAYETRLMTTLDETCAAIRQFTASRRDLVS